MMVVVTSIKNNTTKKMNERRGDKNESKEKKRIWKSQA
jgi:hypothetical protein